MTVPTSPTIIDRIHRERTIAMRDMHNLKHFMKQQKWIIISISLGLAALAASAYIMYREIYRPKTASNILATFGYMFRNVNDIDELNRHIQSQKMLPVKKSDKLTNDTCRLSCRRRKAATYGMMEDIDESFVTSNDNKDSTHWPRTAAVQSDPTRQYYNHGCCVSYQEFFSPYSLKGAIDTGKEFRVVQFKHKKQVFLTEICEQANACKRGCDCRQFIVSNTALVVDGEATGEDFDENDDINFDDINVRIELVQYPGWCKCMNKS